MKRIGKKIEGIQYTKRQGAYAIIEREEDDKIVVAKPIEEDYEILWINPKEYKDKLYHEYQRYIIEEYMKLGTHLN